MTIKKLINELSKYDENLQIYMCMEIEVDDSWYNGQYYAPLENIYDLNHNLIFYGDNNNYLKKKKHD